MDNIVKKINFTKADMAMFNNGIRNTPAVCKKSRRYEGSLVIGVPGVKGALIMTKKSETVVLMHHFPTVDPKTLATESWPQNVPYYDVDFCEDIDWLEFADWIQHLIPKLQDPYLHHMSEEYDNLVRSCFGHM